MLVILVIMLASCSCNPACRGSVVVIVMSLKFPLNLVKFLACVYVT